MKETSLAAYAMRAVASQPSMGAILGLPAPACAAGEGVGAGAGAGGAARAWAVSRSPRSGAGPSLLLPVLLTHLIGELPRLQQ